MRRNSVICGLIAIAAAGPPPALAARWSVHVLPRPAASTVIAHLSGVSCPSATSCVAVGAMASRAGAKLPLLERWNGIRWSRQPAPRLRGASFDAVSCISDRSCVAVGSIEIRSGVRGLLERLSHGVWTTRSVSRPLSSVSCAATGACTAVGGSLALRWDGRRWRRQRIAKQRAGSLAAVSLQAVSCPSSRSCVAVGSTGCESLVERWNGSRWTIQSTPEAGDCTRRGTGAPVFTGVSCASAGACTAVGTLQALNEGQIDRPIAARWNGVRWSKQRIAHVAGDVACASPRSCTTVGVQPPIVAAEHWNGRRWTTQPLPAPRTPALGWSLDSVSCASQTMCVAVGGLTERSARERPLIAEYRGAAG